MTRPTRLEAWLSYRVLNRVLEMPRKTRTRKRGPARNAKYRAWVRSLPCLVRRCQWKAEAAHTGPHALGQKASDYSVVPLCIRHHREGPRALDKIGRMKFEKIHRVSIERTVKELNQAWMNRSFLTAA
jgi:hypothetical protein